MNPPQLAAGHPVHPLGPLLLDLGHLLAHGLQQHQPEVNVCQVDIAANSTTTSCSLLITRWRPS